MRCVARNAHPIFLGSANDLSVTLEAVAEDAPIPKLAYMILLSAVEKTATHVAIADHEVRFLTEGTWSSELKLPAVVTAPVVRRLAIMASLPMVAKGGVAVGLIKLELKQQLVWFCIEVDHDPITPGQMRARLEAISERDWSPGRRPLLPTKHPYR